MGRLVWLAILISISLFVVLQVTGEEASDEQDKRHFGWHHHRGGHAHHHGGHAHHHGGHAHHHGGHAHHHGGHGHHHGGHAHHHGGHGHHHGGHGHHHGGHGHHHGGHAHQHGGHHGHGHHGGFFGLGGHHGHHGGHHGHGHHGGFFGLGGHHGHHGGHHGHGHHGGFFGLGGHHGHHGGHHGGFFGHLHLPGFFFGHGHGHGHGHGNAVKPVIHIQGCDLARQKGDLVFLVDGSGSIGLSQFRVIKQFIISVAQGLAIGPDAVRVGLVEFSGWKKRPRHRTIFHLPQHKSQDAVLKAIHKTPYMRGSTRTGAALEFTLGELFGRAPRSGVPRILVLITDGKSQDHVSGPGQHLRDSGIEIFTIGVGNFNRHQLEAIASKPKDSHILTVNNVKVLESIGETLLKSVCSAAQAKPKPQPKPLPPPPPPEPAPEPRPENELQLELIFLIDGTIPQSQFAYIINFLNAIVGRLSLGNDYTRIAILVIGTDTSYVVPFSGSRTELVSSFLKLHAAPGSRNLGLALKYVASNLLNKARPNAAKFIVTILGGPPADDFSTGLADVESMGGSVIALGAGLDAQILEQIASSHSLFVSWTSLSSLVSYSSSFITLVYEPIIEETEPSTTNMDVVFLVDGSNGVSDTDFVEIRRFLSNSVSSIDVRPDRHRLAIVQIGGQPHTDLLLDSTGGKKAALAAISKMSRTKGARNVGQALTYVLTNVLNPQHGARPYTGKMVVMVVGGATADDVTGPVGELRNLGISVLIVGVAYSDTTALEAIASSPDFVSTYNSFGMLESFSLTTEGSTPESVPQHTKIGQSTVEFQTIQVN